MEQIRHKICGGDEEDNESKVGEPRSTSPECVEHPYSDGLGKTMIDTGEDENENHAEYNNGSSLDVGDGHG